MVELVFLQTIVNGLITGSLFYLAAVGLTLQYKLMKLPNISHAEFFAIGAYATHLFADVLKIGFFVGIALGSLLTGVIGILSYLAVFKPLQSRGATIIHLTIASVGYAFFLRYMLWQIGGRQSYYFSEPFPPIDIGPLRLTTLWILLIVLALLVAVSLHLIMMKTKSGKALRALSENPLLARLSGVRSELVMILVWFMAALLAGMGGALRAADTRIIPELGFEVLIPMFAVSILGSIGSIVGALVAAYSLGMAESVGVLILNFLNLSTEYKSLISFSVLVATIIWAPEGIGHVIARERRRLD